MGPPVFLLTNLPDGQAQYTVFTPNSSYILRQAMKAGAVLLKVEILGTSRLMLEIFLEELGQSEDSQSE